MNFETLSPQEQVATLTRRIYERGITTASGGNLSIRDENGDTWVTPARMDKGKLQAADVVCVKATGEIVGKYSPSTEFPFHRAIYENRPDIRAVAHAHCPSLVAYSMVRKIPQTHAIAQAHHVCGEVGYAPYATTQSAELGEKIAAAFIQGANVVLMENHGIVTGGPDLLSAYQRLETLEFCAQTLLRASVGLGPVSVLDERQLKQFEQRENCLPEFEPEGQSEKEFALREEMCRMVYRGYNQRLMTSTQGIVSVRLDENSFLITPHGVDRHYLEADQIVLIRDGSQEAGKLPSRAVRLHERIYADHPKINAIISAQLPNAMAFAITGHKFEYRTIAESYITLKSIDFAPFEWQMHAPEKVSALLTGKTPVVLMRNDAVLTAGTTLLAAFDRLEVTEFSARALIDSISIGAFVPLNKEQTSELDDLYFPEMMI